MTQEQRERLENRELLMRSIRWELSMDEEDDDEKEAWASFWFEFLNEE